MKQQVLKFLKEYSTLPLEVDRLIVSTYITVNNLRINNNIYLKQYQISENNPVEYSNLNKFVSIVNQEILNFGLEDLIELFEFVISPSDRIVNGAIYTPSEIRSYIISQSFRKIGNQLINAKIADISCGCSGFLYSAAKEIKRRTGNTYQIIFQNQIFGLDIQEYSVTRSKLLLSLLALSEGEDIEQFYFNIHQGDTLIFNWSEVINDFQGFEIIVGNPPYVSARNLDIEAKD